MNEDLMSFEEAVSQYLLEDPRYPAEAYYFVRDGFEYVIRGLADKGERPRHLSGSELADGLKATGADGRLVGGPVWEDNFISLLPGESRTVLCRAEGAQISVDSWN